MMKKLFNTDLLNIILIIILFIGGHHLKETELTIRSGRIVYDQNGISARSWLENQSVKF